MCWPRHSTIRPGNGWPRRSATSIRVKGKPKCKYLKRKFQTLTDRRCHWWGWWVHLLVLYKKQYFQTPNQQATSNKQRNMLPSFQSGFKTFFFFFYLEAFCDWFPFLRGGKTGNSDIFLFFQAVLLRFTLFFELPSSSRAPLLCTYWLTLDLPMVFCKSNELPTFSRVTIIEVTVLDQSFNTFGTEVSPADPNVLLTVPNRIKMNVDWMDNNKMLERLSVFQGSPR